MVTGTLTVYVNVTDLNDHKPEFSQSVYSFTVRETAREGLVVGKVTASDGDIGMNAKVR